MSVKIKALITYLMVSIIIIIIESLSGISLNIYHYLDIFLKTFSEVTTPMLPTSGNWADSAEDAISMTNMVRFFFRIISSPIPLIMAIIVYYLDDKY
ncbi:hypothetical protein KAR91_34835 [Candidatus Pacearchaeota archaeon]|nr:hypothetical protein [Candidatus Pacearchaeota archaeon]